MEAPGWGGTAATWGHLENIPGAPCSALRLLINFPAPTLVTESTWKQRLRPGQGASLLSSRRFATCSLSYCIMIYSSLPVTSAPPSPPLPRTQISFHLPVNGSQTHRLALGPHRPADPQDLPFREYRGLSHPAFPRFHIRPVSPDASRSQRWGGTEGSPQ